MNENVCLPDEITRRKPSAGEESKTLSRGLAVMDAVLAGPQEGMRVAELCRQTGLERATIYRLLAALQEARYVTLVSRYRYGPGERWRALVPCSKQREDLAQRLAPVLAAISEGCGDAAFAVVRDGGLSHCIARHVGSYPIQILVIQVGTRQPLGVGAAGLALLSALADREVEAVLDVNAPALALYGGMTQQRLRLLVLATRERGWSLVGNHATQNVLAVGLPVCDASGDVLAGISVAATENRMPRERQRRIVQLMRKSLRAHGFDAF
ncbi:IclR family transcriptional regulator [Comamonas thiooxydans]|uniref:IclR family transcriptional regulator n=1 Tax=Comamonas thiooxydans TaxID=363952 RepID=UPI0005F80C6B|nr:IclR family transcriptional regulator C-terminal domain-containing protein [Comamonas thiooxydans]MCO8251428.1 helix-turn-helix domain-containing protein [Comamonas thiooxydans]UBQ40510.1 helix-turn-helix domain-containing protein [Comamonas thiooxydans]CUA98831.1 transcriptional regulator, IclR family [Comamonas thiooxydans]